MNNIFFSINEFSKMIGLSKSIIYYYHKIGLLKITRNKENNYRIFTKNDFIQIQKIISLKTLGFKLQDIKKIINKQFTGDDLQKNIIEQINYIENKIKDLSNLHNLLCESLIDIQNNSYDNNLNCLVEIIRKYNMYNNIKASWLQEILTPSTLDFISKKPSLSKDEENNLVETWNILIHEIESAIKNNIDPNSDIGLTFAKKFMNLVKSMGDSDQDRAFGLEVWEAYKTGKIEEYQRKFPDQIFFINIQNNTIQWIDQAVHLMYWLVYTQCS